jgi:predicted dehydrogenase
MVHPIRFGIIGCGDAAIFHITAFKRKVQEKLEFVAAHDTNSRTLKRFSRAHKLQPYTTLQDILESEIDAVLVSVPHYLHEEIVNKAAKAGKHVLCEKPMARTLEECDAMIKATENANVKFMIAENHRFLPAHQRIKDFIDEGLLGDIFLIRSYEGAYCDPKQFLNPESWHFCYKEGGGGVVADQGVHKFSTINWLLNDSVDSITCWIGKAYNSPDNKGEDNAIILVRYRKGTMVEITLSSTTLHPLTNKIELHGTKGTIFEDHSWEKPIQIYSNHPNAEKIGTYFTPEVEHGPFPQYYLISAFYEDMYFSECIRDDRKPEFTPLHAKDAVAGVLLSYLAAKEGGRVCMEELMDFAKENNTELIFQNLDDAIQKNYTELKWDL